MILDNAQILTLDDTLPRTATIAIAGGRVIGGVDSREDVIANHAHEHVDLQGATVVPGLVDSHVHFRAWALSRVRVRLQDAVNAEQLSHTVLSHASTCAHDDWVLGSGWLEQALPADIDAGALLTELVAGRPAALVSKDGHALWCNQIALDRLGITLEDIAVPGGIIERDEAGVFRGVLRETSAWVVRRALPTTDLTTKTLATAMREAARRGITTIHDMDGSSGLRSWRTLERERGLSIRVVQHLLAEDLHHAREVGLDYGFGSDRLQIGGIKVFADGTLGSGTAWLHEPALAAAGSTSHGTSVVISDLTQLITVAEDAARAGFPLLVHAIGDAAFTAATDALEATAPLWSPLRARPRIEHAQLVRPDDLQRCARLGIALSVQPAHAIADRTLAAAAWGDRLDRAYAYGTMLDAGCTLLLGSDAPIEELDPIAALRAAIAGDGASPAHQLMAAEDALRACTSAPHLAAGTGSQLGRLSLGCHADLTVLSGDPTTDDIGSIEVVATMVGGRWTYGASTFG